MEPLELKADLTLCGLVTAVTVILCLPLSLMMLAAGQWLAATLALTPAPVLAFWWRRGRSLIFYDDRLEDRTRFSVTVISYAGVTAIFRLHDPRSARGTGHNAHLPILSLQRDGRLLLTVPRSLYRKSDIQQADALLRKLRLFRKYL